MISVERRRRKNVSVVGGDMQVHVEWNGESIDVCDTPGTVAIRRGLPILWNGRVGAEIKMSKECSVTRRMDISGDLGQWTVLRRRRRSYVVREDGSVLLCHSGAGPRLLGHSYWHALIDADGHPLEVGIAIGLWTGGYLTRTRLLFLPETAALRHPVPPVTNW